MWAEKQKFKAAGSGCSIPGEKSLARKLERDSRSEQTSTKRLNEAEGGGCFFFPFFSILYFSKVVLTDVFLLKIYAGSEEIMGDQEL